MADAQVQPVTVSDEIRSQFPELIELILGSESMNNEERQYWINILPVMKPSQVENLQNILVNEKRQLEAIDKKYATQIKQAGQSHLLKTMEEERKKRRDERHSKEEEAMQKEEEATQDILQQINEV